MTTTPGHHAEALDPIELTAALVRCPSVTPANAGALDLLERWLTALGFRCTRLPFSEPGTPDVDNLYARLGERAPHFCFAGHTDVVPAGDEAAWSAAPFEANISDGLLFGRGATDMKGAIAAFVAAVSRFIRPNDAFPGSISLLITGDEEGPAINGTSKMLRWLKAQGEVIDHCLVGEPTNLTTLGQTIKIGRRGSVNGRLTVRGRQGHVAYPSLADNPVPKLVRILAAITAAPLDEATEHFQASNLEITDIEVGNPATNVIPAQARARFNIRFNDTQTTAGLDAWLRRQIDEVMAGEDGTYELEMTSSGEAFITPPGPFSSLVAEAVRDVTGTAPELSTSGGTSDARFIKDYAPVAEFGLISQTMHKTDECVALADLRKLSEIYGKILETYFRTGW